MAAIKEVTYRCAGRTIKGDRVVETKCAKDPKPHEQTIRFSVDEAVPPNQLCQNCKAGFGVDLGTAMQNRIGMFVVDTKIDPNEPHMSEVAGVGVGVGGGS